MRKEELRKLKRIYATPKMVRMAKDNCKKMEYRIAWDETQKKILPTEFDFLVRCQSRGRYLMVCVFHPEWVKEGILHPLYEIYCNPEGDEYITRIMKADGTEDRWSRAMFDNLYNVYYRIYERYWMKDTDGDRRIWQNPEGRDTIKTYLKTGKEGIYGLAEWQRRVKEKKTEEEEKRQKAPWDSDMRLVPAVMPSFKKWMQEEAADQYFIIYEYHKGKKPDEGWCSGCRKFVPVEKPGHGREGKCPKCGRDIRFKSAGKIKTLSTGWYSAQCIQKIPGGIVVREFAQYQYYRDRDYKDPHVITNETKRVFIMDDGTVKRYVYGLYKNKESRFIPDRYGYTRNVRTKLYLGNIAALKKTALKTSSIDMWIRRERKELPCGTVEYLAAEKGNPAVEKLAKIGMFRLAQEMIHVPYRSGREIVDQDATELSRILKIDSARLRRLKTMDGGIGHLVWLQMEKAVDRILPDGMIKDFGDSGIKAGDFGFLIPPPGYVKIWNYMKRQQALAGDSLEKILQTWRDYINMAKKLKMDVKKEQIWKPKNLKAAHNGAVLLLQKGEMEKEAAGLEKKWTKVNGILPELKKFAYADKKFTILAPESILDIVKEGRILQHCVHTCDFYFDRIQKNETYLFFLRRTGQEDVPWYTLEVEAGGNIRQKRTTGDNQNKDFEEAVPFLRKWQKYFLKQMTEAEKELGKKAEQARRQEYEKLRRDGNRVWHGKLAGHLLADVLEADFMAAAT